MDYLQVEVFMHKIVNGVRKECTPEEEKAILESWKNGEEKLKERKRILQEKKNKKSLFIQSLSKTIDMSKSEIE
jgi:hypothetical protein